MSVSTEHLLAPDEWWCGLSILFVCLIFPAAHEIATNCRGDLIVRGCRQSAILWRRRSDRTWLQSRVKRRWTRRGLRHAPRLARSLAPRPRRKIKTEKIYYNLGLILIFRWNKIAKLYCRASEPMKMTFIFVT